jgi:hypothetical protein
MNKERHIQHNIKNKLQSNKAVITKADKSNIIVITYQQDYHNEIKDFITKNNLVTVTSDPTKIFQKKIPNIVNEFQIVIHKDQRWKYVNLNPAAPYHQKHVKNT